MMDMSSREGAIMTERSNGFLAAVVGRSVLALVMGVAAARGAQEPSGSAPSAPRPSAAVQRSLDEAKCFSDARQPLESLGAADDALAAARAHVDTAGVALAQEARGTALQGLERTAEALAAWDEAAQTWAGSGETLRQVRALVGTGLVCLPDSCDSDEFFGRGLSAVKTAREPAEAIAQTLYEAGVAIGDRGAASGGAGVPGQQAAMDYLRAALDARGEDAPEDWKLVEMLNALGKCALVFGDDQSDDQSVILARDSYARAAEIGKRLGPPTPLLVDSLHKLGACEHGLSETDPAAREHYLEALHLQQGLVPDGSAEEASILRELGVFELNLSRFADARQYLERAATVAKTAKPGSPLYARILLNLADLEDQEGDLSSARATLDEVLKTNQELHADLGPTYMNLGAVTAEQYDFEAARFFFGKALLIFQETAPEKSGVPFTLGDLALTLDWQGDFSAALEYSERSLDIQSKTYPNSRQASQGWAMRGIILRDLGELDRAADSFQRALGIQDKGGWGESTAASDTLLELVKLERTRGRLDAADSYGQRALRISRAACPNRWCTAAILNELGQVAYEQGDLATAEGRLRQAVEIREQSLGPTHPDFARSLNSLALVVGALGRRHEAEEMALRAEGIGAQHVRMSVRTLSERQALAYEGIRASGLDLALSLVPDGEDAGQDRAKVLDAVIRSRALVFDELAARHRSVKGGGDLESARLSAQLLSARKRLATLVYRGVGDSTPEVYRTLLEDARQQKEKAERELAERSVAFRQEQARSQLGLDDVARSLPPGASLVAFVRYARVDLQRPAAGKRPRAPVPSYAAFVLLSGREPAFVRLGRAREIESSLAAWRRDIAQQAETLGAFGGSEITYRRLGAALRRQIWDPLVPYLGGATEVLVVPDGALHLVSFGSLPVGASRYVVETRLIHYLSTERDLVPHSSRRGDGILVVGNPAFDQTSRRPGSSESLAAMNAGASENDAAMRGLRSACGTFRTLQFSPLPASQQEVEEVARLWSARQTEQLRGVGSAAAVADRGDSVVETHEGASREAFEASAPGKRVLHIATHGFFLEGSCESALQGRLSTQQDRALPATAENPLLLSGLAFAGANRRVSAKPDESDGILTAEEIAGIDLEGVDWAVLSACDTGVGEIKVGEGVFGLRRAFQIAGARTVIMSLWPVEDKATRQWMATLYFEHFLEGKSTPESVRAATLEALRDRRAKHLSTHPFYWGAFIAGGDWQ
jgi:tetratricopeptide (TPR) repeat protein